MTFCLSAIIADDPFIDSTVNLFYLNFTILALFTIELIMPNDFILFWFLLYIEYHFMATFWCLFKFNSKQAS